MHLTSTLFVSAAIVSITASPITFPLPDGFPNPNNAELIVIEQKLKAHLPPPRFLQT